MEYLFVLGRILYGGYFVKAGINHFQSLTMLAGYAGMKGVPAPKVAVMLSDSAAVADEPLESLAMSACNGET